MRHGLLSLGSLIWLDTDLLKAQSILYRRLSANLYETETPGDYFHLHGSLEATTALNMIGLEGHRPDMTGYHDAINLIESHVKKFTVDELEKMNAEKRQAGVTCLKWEDFKKTNYVRVIEYLELTILILLRDKVSSSKVLGSLKSLRRRLRLRHFLRWTQEMGNFGH